MMHLDLSTPNPAPIIVNNNRNNNLPPTYVLDQGTEYWKFKTKEYEEKVGELEKKLHHSGNDMRSLFNLTFKTEIMVENLKKENEKLKTNSELVDSQQLKGKTIAQLKELEKKYKKSCETISDALTLAIESEMERAKLGGIKMLKHFFKTVKLSVSFVWTTNARCCACLAVTWYSIDNSSFNVN
jgi:hypothetical protein